VRAVVGDNWQRVLARGITDHPLATVAGRCARVGPHQGHGSSPSRPDRPTSRSASAGARGTMPPGDHRRRSRRAPHRLRRRSPHRRGPRRRQQRHLARRGLLGTNSRRPGLVATQTHEGRPPLTARVRPRQHRRAGRRLRSARERKSSPTRMSQSRWTRTRQSPADDSYFNFGLPHFCLRPENAAAPFVQSRATSAAPGTREERRAASCGPDECTSRCHPRFRARSGALPSKTRCPGRDGSTDSKRWGAQLSAWLEAMRVALRVAASHALYCWVVQPRSSVRSR
jgi:hypothetical protein